MYNPEDIMNLQAKIKKKKLFIYLLVPCDPEESKKLFLHLLEHPLMALYMPSIAPYTTNLHPKNNANF